MQVALATFAALPDGFEDEYPLVDALRADGVEARYVVWDRPDVDWSAFDVVVVRSVWDYSRRRDEFLEWAWRVGDRLENPPAVIEWNTDKRYLDDLRADGLPVVPTTYVAPGDPVPGLAGTVVVKPTISAGGRDSGRFGPAAHADAAALIERLAGEGRTAMVQPFLESVETNGEAALVYFRGALSHTLRKGPVLPPDRVAPQREYLPGLSAAEAMFEPDLVQAAPAADDELELAEAVVAALARRFGAPPLYARVDLVRDDDGVPAIMEIELTEPNFYLQLAPGAAERLAAAIPGRV